MKKLFFILAFIALTGSVFSQNEIFSDDQLKVVYSVDQLTDEVNDLFYEYYSFQITNTSSNEVSFLPEYRFKTEKGETKTSADFDEHKVVTLAAGEVIKGSLATHRNLTLFKQFLPGNSGKRSSDQSYTLESVTINYK